ncbi:hypothetical protein L9F63_012707 [Diploptera punctata]|uniref:Coiled-coil domain-containing protein 134 n=1 Tax=Diploptera punctata TaxID=6984 RepID=A0AAD8ADV7_DIPPU|nr:hypothetical protein L9F63_012707 [Diploptera punctata]
MKRRREQLEAVKSLVAIDSYEKQHKMVTLMADKIFSVIEKCRVELQTSGYIPANSSFPHEQDVLDALANTLENTALFGDVLLRLPDITHKILKSKPEWRELIQWSVAFVNKTNLLDKQTIKLMHLVSQELNIVEKDPDYVNPYSENYKRKQEEQLMASTITAKKKKKKERRKGPQLSRGHSKGEL